MKHLSQIILLLLLAVFLSGCSRPRGVATRYFEAVRNGDAWPYMVAGVSNYVVVDYEIVRQSGNTVIVRITFSARKGNDIVQTKRFEVRHGRLCSTEPDEIEEAIRTNLTVLRNKLMKGLVRWSPDCSSGEKIKMCELLGEEHLLDDFNKKFSVNGEDYNTVVFHKIVDIRNSYSSNPFKFDASVADRDGKVVHIYEGVSGFYLQ